MFWAQGCRCEGSLTWFESRCLRRIMGIRMARSDNQQRSGRKNRDYRHQCCSTLVSVIPVQSTTCFLNPKETLERCFGHVLRLDITRKQEALSNGHHLGRESQELAHGVGQSKRKWRKPVITKPTPRSLFPPSLQKCMKRISSWFYARLTLRKTFF